MKSENCLGCKYENNKHMTNCYLCNGIPIKLEQPKPLQDKLGTQGDWESELDAEIVPDEILPSNQLFKNKLKSFIRNLIEKKDNAIWILKEALRADSEVYRKEINKLGTEIVIEMAKMEGYQTILGMKDKEISDLKNSIKGEK